MAMDFALSKLMLLWIVTHAIRLSADGSLSSRPKVLILGGGLAGLQVGKVLQSRGVRDFLILEADSALGGRVVSGCVKGVPACSTHMLVESRLGSPHPLADLLDACSIAYSVDPFANIVSVNEDGKDVSEEVYNALLRADQAASALIQGWDANEDDMSVEGALRLYGWTPRTPEELAVDVFYSDIAYAGKPSEISTREYVSDAITSVPPNSSIIYDSYVIRDSYFGNQRLVDCLERSFLSESDERVHLNTTVTQVSYSDSGVTVNTTDGTLYEADYAVVTFSLGVLQQQEVIFSPPLSYRKRKAINQFRMGYHTLLYVKFQSRIDGSLVRPGPDPLWYFYVSSHRNVYPIAYELFENIEDKVNHTQPFNLFVHWIFGDDALRVETQPLNKTKAEVTEIYRKFFGSSTPEPEQIAVSTANTNPFYHGGIPSFPSGASHEDYDILREPVGRVYFAGDAYHMTTSFSGMTRALFSGDETAAALLDCINGDSCSMTKHATEPVQCPTGNGGFLISVPVVTTLVVLAMSLLIL